MSFKNKILILFLLLVSFGTSVFGQSDTSRTVIPGVKKITENYEKAFFNIAEMLDEKKVSSFKKAVFATENAYFDNTFDYTKFDAYIKDLALITKTFMKSSKLINYKEKDSINFSLNGAIYTLLKDTIRIINGVDDGFHSPFIYDFEDFFGSRDWEKTFVFKLLSTHSGNCHSLPYLYKITADEIGAKCWLSLAPQHIYIKNYSKQFGWYNTELTSKQFPTEGWIMASGYITLEAIQNGIFMDTIGTKQAIALCLVDLANGYNRKVKNNSGNFILKCCDLSLKYFPTNITAMLLKAETLKAVFLTNKENELGKKTYQEMLDLYVKIYKLGYREMPEEMYIEWMKSLQTQKDKYINKKISDTFKNTKK